MNTQDRIALVIGRLVIEQEVKGEQLEQAAKRIAELEKDKADGAPNNQ